MSSYIKYKVVIKNFGILDIDNELINQGEISYNKESILNDDILSINITLKSIKDEKNIFILEINSENRLNKQQLTSIADELIDDLLNKIAFFYIGAKVGEPWITSSSFIDEKMNTLEFAASIFVDTQLQREKKLGILCKEIKINTSFAQDDYRMFRSAMNNEDVVSKYMFLYQILLFRHLNDKGYESQKSVDNFIKSKLTEARHQYQNWEDTKRAETIYTRLRNQVGHYRGKTPLETRNDMTGKIDELIELVRLSIY